MVVLFSSDRKSRTEGHLVYILLYNTYVVLDQIDLLDQRQYSYILLYGLPSAAGLPPACPRRIHSNARGRDGPRFFVLYVRVYVLPREKKIELDIYICTARNVHQAGPK